MKYLYYCNSLYQLITVLKLHFQRKENGFENIKNYYADLIILNAFAGGDDVYRILVNNDIFDNVWLIDKNNKKSGHIKTIINLLFPLTCIKSFGINDINIKNRYDVIDTPKYSKLMSSIWQLNKNAELQLIDEGLSSYLNTTALESHSIIYNKFFKYFNNGKTFKDFDSCYLNNKEMTIYDNDKFIEIPKSENTIDKLKKLFCSMSIENRKKIIWFDQYYCQKDIKKSIDDTLGVLAKYKNDVLFCPHPRNPVKSNIFENKIENSMWEINVLNNDKINDICLVTHNSTACLSPKLLFDFEPLVIMTYGLIENNTEKIDKYINKVKSTYSDCNKIMIPRSIEELDAYLSRIMKQL